MLIQYHTQDLHYLDEPRNLQLRALHIIRHFESTQYGHHINHDGSMSMIVYDPR